MVACASSIPRHSPTDRFQPRDFEAVVFAVSSTRPGKAMTLAIPGRGTHDTIDLADQKGIGGSPNGGLDWRSKRISSLPPSDRGPRRRWIPIAASVTVCTSHGPARSRSRRKRVSWPAPRLSTPSSPYTSGRDRSATQARNASSAAATALSLDCDVESSRWLCGRRGD